jgi:signal transduction histidine kinase
VDALAAFAHELRTPLTSLRMVIDLSLDEKTRTLSLDEELSQALLSSLQQLERLADEVQELSRLERGRINLNREPATLAAALERARAWLGPGIRLTLERVESGPSVEDGQAFARALAAMAKAANDAGDGSGEVVFVNSQREHELIVSFECGPPGGERPIGSDASLPLYRARLLLAALDGTVMVERGTRYCRVAARLPLEAREHP